MDKHEKIYDLIIIGGGQSALACGYYLRRADLEYLILDDGEKCGGAWRHAWDSLTLFSPAKHSSLPGWFMPPSEGNFPHRREVIDYLCRYEERYHLPIERPVKVVSVHREDEIFRIESKAGIFRARTVISATGTWQRPIIPNISGREKFRGRQLHSAHYQKPDDFKNQKVLIVGEGNSGAQILAEVSRVATTEWATREEPQFLPDDVDGRVLFDLASAKYYAQQKGEKFDASQYNLGNIVMVPPVKKARKRGDLKARRTFSDLYEDGVIWPDGQHESFDVIIWCTGFGYATDHLRDLVETDSRGKIKTEDTRARDIPGLWLVGYGGWTGYASATLIGVGRSARQTIQEIREFLKT